MPTRKEVWVSGNDAAAILTRNSGHTISTNYVRLLAAKNKIRSRAKNGREKEYLESDLKAYKVTKKGTSEADSRVEC